MRTNIYAEGKPAEIKEVFDWCNDNGLPIEGEYLFMETIIKIRPNGKIGSYSSLQFPTDQVTLTQFKKEIGMIKFSEELDKGFQIDISKLTKDEVDHVLRIFEGKGVKWADGSKATEYKPHGTYLLYNIRYNIFVGTVLTSGRLTHSDFQLIDYPTLCNAVGEQVVSKPKYLKGKDSGVIVEYLGEGSDHTRFNGKVIVTGESGYRIGKIDNYWVTNNFEPCDYTPEKESADNAQCKPTTEDIAAYVVDLIAPKFDLQKQLDEAKDTIAELENKIANLTSKPSQPKEPETKYTKEWLDMIVNKYNSYYWYFSGGICFVGNSEISPETREYMPLGAKKSAFVIVNALAKELNPMFEKDENGDLWFIECNDGVWEIICESSYNVGGAVFTSYDAAEKALDILKNNFKEVLSNYL